MFRLALVVMVLGGVLAFFGGQELLLALASSSTPVEVELADLENGAEPPDNHLLVGPHWRVYGGLVYYGDDSRDRDRKVDYCYYPIISRDHAWSRAVTALHEEFDDLQNVPDERWPEVEDFHVVVKTKEYDTYRDLPEGYTVYHSDLQGLVINKIDSLKSEEKRLLAENFPNVDLDSLVIIEAGRRPSSLAKALGMLGAGLAILAVPPGYWLYRRDSASSVSSQWAASGSGGAQAEDGGQAGDGEQASGPAPPVGAEGDKDNPYSV